MTNEQYHSSPGISASDFRLLEESVLHFENKQLFKLEGSHFTLGSLVHKMVLEADQIDEEFIKETFDGCDLNKNSKTYKEAKAEFSKQSEGLEVVPVDVWQKAEKMASNVRAIAGGIFQGGVAEMSVFAEDGEYGITRKCRPDYFLEKEGVCIDLKTTADGSDRAFSRALIDFRYSLQAAWYIDTLRRAGKNAETFIFVTVETKKPYMVRIRELDVTAIVYGRELYKKLLNDYAIFKNTGVANVIGNISIPKWASEELVNV